MGNGPKVKIPRIPNNFMLSKRNAKYFSHPCKQIRKGKNWLVKKRNGRRSKKASRPCRKEKWSTPRPRILNLAQILNPRKASRGGSMFCIGVKLTNHGILSALVRFHFQPKKNGSLICRRYMMKRRDGRLWRNGLSAKITRSPGGRS